MDDGRRSFTHHLMKKIHRHQSLHVRETFYEGIHAIVKKVAELRLYLG